MKLVLLSDASLNGSKSRPIAEAMQSTFHPSICSVLTLKYSTISSEGSCPAIKSFVFDLLTLTVLPDLEYRIRSLNTSLTNIRKGQADGSDPVTNNTNSATQVFEVS